MASEAKTHLHFALFPFMAQGHMIPMMDIARMLARRGLLVTVFTTHKNADRFEPSLDRAVRSGLRIRLVKLRFPSAEVGLPEGCENLDTLPGPGTGKNLFEGIMLLHRQAEELFGELAPRPCCIISDMCIPWTLDIADKFSIPRVTFSGFSNFFLACLGKVRDSDVLNTLGSDSEFFPVPGLPDHVEFTRGQMHLAQEMKDPSEILGKIAVADKASYGAIVNSFDELEPAYVEEYKRVRGGKAWCIGPVSLSNEGELDKAQRGNKAAISVDECLSWLHSWERGSVVYASMGSICNLIPSQVMELGLGLEASDKPFIWVIREGKRKEELEKMIAEDGLEERVKGRGLLIRGWAPQVLILSHPSIGAFLTHCGWNSTLEGICAGLPLISWPFIGDQFGNEKLIERVLKIGVGVGVEVPVKWDGEEKIGVLVRREDVKRAIERVMDGGEEGEERRKRVQELGNWAKGAVEDGGSSHRNLSMFIQDIMQMESNHN